MVGWETQGLVDSGLTKSFWRSTTPNHYNVKNTTMIVKHKIETYSCALEF